MSKQDRDYPLQEPSQIERESFTIQSENVAYENFACDFEPSSQSKVQQAVDKEDESNSEQTVYEETVGMIARTASDFSSAQRDQLIHMLESLQCSKADTNEIVYEDLPELLSALHPSMSVVESEDIEEIYDEILESPSKLPPAIKNPETDKRYVASKVCKFLASY